MSQGYGLRSAVRCFCVFIWITCAASEPGFARPWYPGRSDNRVSLGNVDSRLHSLKNGMIDYVIHRGCSYMSMYIRSHYIHHRSHKRFAKPRNIPGSPGSCSWEQYVGKTCDTYHIPSEFRHALIDCGPAYSVIFLHSEAMSHGCDLSMSSLVGKRMSSVEPGTISSGTKDGTTRYTPRKEASEWFISGLKIESKRRIQNSGVTDDDVDHRMSVDHQPPDPHTTGDDHYISDSDPHTTGDDHYISDSDPHTTGDDHYISDSDPHTTADHHHHQQGPDPKQNQDGAWNLNMWNRTVPTPFLQSWCQTFSRLVVLFCVFFSVL